MTSQTSEIYDLSPAGAAPPPPARPVTRKTPRTLRTTARILTWAMIATFLLGGGLWAFHAGMDARREIWQSTRSIRFKEDIAHAYTFGNRTLRFAESQANLEPKADAFANQSPKILARAGYPNRPSGPTFRRLTPLELARGLVAYMDDVVNQNPDGTYEVDYPALRLAVMTLWVRHVQRIHPDMDEYPAQRTDDTTLAQDEDVAQPLLTLNAYCAAAASIAIFLLVFVWIRRSFKPAKPLRLPPWLPNLKSQISNSNPPIRPLAPRWTVPHGIFAFILATAGFWYAYMTLVHFPPRPAPMVSLIQIQPDAAGANLIVNINAQNQDTQWRIDFGPSPAYGQSTGLQGSDTSLVDQQLSVRLQPLQPGQTVHFRISATGPGGTTNSSDFLFRNQGPPIDLNSAPEGGLVWPTWSVWFRLLALFIIMVASAQMLPPIHRGWACGAVAAMLIWCDPLLLIDSHAWPQWDVWILPFFLFAALLASINFWLPAGILLGVGCMFKGQLLLAGPILILWPLFEGRWSAFAKIAIGCLLGAEFITWPWLLNSHTGQKWVDAAIAAACLILLASFMRSALAAQIRRWIIDPLFPFSGVARDALSPPSNESLVTSLLLASALLAAITFATALVFHGIAAQRSHLPPATLGLFLLLVLIPPWFLPRRSLPYWLAAVLVIAVPISSAAFGGSYSWATLGYAYGSIKHDQMQMSIRNFSNLTSILSQSYQWDIHDPMGTLKFSFTTPGPWRIGHFAIPSVAWSWSTDLDVKTTMAVLYGICLVIASAAAALHSRRNDRRFLVALVVPWIVFPVVMCQMGDRYPIWACGISAAMVAVSLELSLLHVLLAALTFAMVARQLVAFDPNRWPQLIDLMTPTFPGIGWMLVLITAIFFVAALIPSRRCAAD